MGKARKSVELQLNPLALVAAILNYVAANLPHHAEEKLDAGEVTFSGITPPLKVSASVFWLQFGKRRRFKHGDFDLTIHVPQAHLVEAAFQLVLNQSTAKGLGAYEKFLQMFGFPPTAQDESETPAALDQLFKTFRESSPELQAEGIALLRLQFAFEIVRCSLLGETIKWYDSILPGLPLTQKTAGKEDRARCVRMQVRFRHFVQIWGRVFQIRYNPDEPVQPKSFIPEVLHSWFETSN